MQHPPTDKILKQRSKILRGSDGKPLSSIDRYLVKKQALFENERSRMGADWFAPFPMVNPYKIIEHSKLSPMSAAFMCQYACSILAKMEERNVREYVATAYFIACDMKDDERAITSLAHDVQDGRYKNGVPINLIREDLLHYLFLYVFHQSGIRKRDRATQYAQGLKEYFHEGRPPELVSAIIIKHGPDRLRRTAQRKANLIKGAQEWANQHQTTAAPSFDEVLATLAAEETKAATTEEADQTFDHGSRDLPPDLSDNEESKISDNDDLATEDDLDDDSNEASAKQAADVVAVENAASEDEVDAEERNDDNAETGFIDGDVIDERLQRILLGTMSLGASLATQPLDPDVKKQVTKMTVSLSNDLIDLRRMLNGV